MDNKIILVFLALVLMSASVFAIPQDLNFNSPTSGTIINGGNSYVIDFNVVDRNTQLNPDSPPAVTLYWSTVSGSRTNTIIFDRNMYDGLLMTCTDYNFTVSQRCTYTWSVPNESTIPSQTTIYIDSNFADYNGTAWTYVYESSSAASVFQPMGSSLCGLMNLIPFALLAGLVILFITMFFAFKSGADAVTVLVSGTGSFIVVLVIAIIIYVLIGQVCVA